jgi:hypothetical protein
MGDGIRNIPSDIPAACSLQEVGPRDLGLGLVGTNGRRESRRVSTRAIVIDTGCFGFSRY